MTGPVDRILYGSPLADGSIPFWRMPTIWAAAEGIEPVEMALESLGVLDDVVWFGGPKNVQPTVRRIAGHARDILAADLGWPIIMTRAGEVLDGAHRIAKAYLDGRASIAAVVIEVWPPPDGVVAGAAPGVAARP